jgi:tRNA pseudouridine38-40 synthase
MRTVEGCLEPAFVTALGQAPRLQVAGRTDAGVHARRQVVSFKAPSSLDLRRLLVSLNALTPSGIVITKLAPARPGFDARRDALSRCYRYHVASGPAASPFWKRYSWWLPGRLDVGLMRESASLVVGRHDFTAFTPTETEHIHFHRLVTRCAWTRRRDGILTLDIEAESFLRNMVRALVGTMVEVGRGRRTLEEFGRLLQGADRTAAGSTAPARGLFLWDIRY